MNSTNLSGISNTTKNRKHKKRFKLGKTVGKFFRKRNSNSFRSGRKQRRQHQKNQGSDGDKRVLITDGGSGDELAERSICAGVSKDSDVDNVAGGGGLSTLIVTQSSALEDCGDGGDESPLSRQPHVVMEEEEKDFRLDNTRRKIPLDICGATEPPTATGTDIAAVATDVIAVNTVDGTKSTLRSTLTLETGTATVLSKVKSERKDREATIHVEEDAWVDGTRRGGITSTSCFGMSGIESPLTEAKTRRTTRMEAKFSLEGLTCSLCSQCVSKAVSTFVLEGDSDDINNGVLGMIDKDSVQVTLFPQSQLYLCYEITQLRPCKITPSSPLSSFSISVSEQIIECIADIGFGAELISNQKVSSQGDIEDSNSHDDNDTSSCNKSKVVYMNIERNANLTLVFLQQIEGIDSVEIYFDSDNNNEKSHEKTKCYQNQLSLSSRSTLLLTNVTSSGATFRLSYDPTVIGIHTVLSTLLNLDHHSLSCLHQQTLSSSSSSSALSVSSTSSTSSASSSVSSEHHMYGTVNIIEDSTHHHNFSYSAERRRKLEMKIRRNQVLFTRVFTLPLAVMSMLLVHLNAPNSPWGKWVLAGLGGTVLITTVEAARDDSKQLTRGRGASTLSAAVLSLLLVQINATKARRRRKVVRSKYQKKCAATILQTFFRLKSAQSKYISMKYASLCIQRWIRGQIELQKYRRVHRFIVICQARIRGQLVRSRYLQMRYAAIILQRFDRLNAAKLRYSSMKKGALCIQKWIRKEILLRKFRRLQLFSVVIQARRRGKVVRLQYLQNQYAATMIQTRARLRAAQSQYFFMKDTVVCIQTWIRCHIILKRYRNLHHFVLITQARRRGKLVRLRYLQMQCATRILSQCLFVIDAVIYIQTWNQWNMMLDNYRRLRHFAIVAQKRRRSIVAQSRYFLMKEAVICIQTRVRCQIFLQRYRCLKNFALFTQARRRGKVARSRYFQITSMRYAVIRIQSWVRGQIMVQKYRRLQYNTIVTQSRRRGKVVRLRYLQIQFAATILQTSARSRAAQCQYIRMKEAVICIQTKIRCQTILQRYRRLQHFVPITQARRRGKVFRLRYLQMQCAACILSQYLLMKNAVIYIQTWIRWKIAYHKYRRLRHFAIVAQTRRRGTVAHFRFNVIKNGVMCIQRWIRSEMMLKKYRRLKLGAVVAQSMRRRKVARTRYLRMRSAVIILQTTSRLKAAKCQYACIKRGLVCIQSLIRMEVSLQNYRRMQVSVVVVQSRRRGKVVRARYLLMQRAVTIIQANSRGKSARSKYLKICLLHNSRERTNGYNSNDTNFKESILNASKLITRTDYLFDDFVASYKEHVIVTGMIKELEDDKQNILHHAQLLEHTENRIMLHAQELTRANTSRIREVSQLQQANTCLKNDIWFVKNQKEECLSSIRQKGTNYIMQQDLKIRTLKMTMDTHWEKLSDTLEALHYARQMEIKKLNMLINQVKSEKDEDIRRLKEEIDILKHSLAIDTCSLDAVCDY